MGWQQLKEQTERAARFHEQSAADQAALADELAKMAEIVKTDMKLVLFCYIYTVKTHV